MSSKAVPILLLLLLAPTLALPAAAEAWTRGPGVYPGDPAEDFSPSLVPAGPGRRNLALHRAASQSSAFDYNLVAQLVTDGIREIVPPRWLSVSTPAEGRLPRHTRSSLLDDNIYTGVEVDEPGWIGFELGGGEAPFAVDRVEAGVGGTSVIL